MKINAEKIIDYVHNLNEDELGFYNLAMQSFYGEITVPDFDPEIQFIEQEDIKKIIGEDNFLNLYPIALEFFLSNEYPDPEAGQVWNVIDVFLKRCGKILTYDEKKYYTGMRSSYMSIYEVIEIDVGKSLTLRDKMQDDSAPIKVFENKATYHLSKWDILGARLVKTGKKLGLAGGLLVLKKEYVDDLVNDIKKIDGLMMQNISSLDDPKGTELLIKKMWVKMIAEAWLEDSMQPSQMPEFFNRDGEKLKLCTLRFPLKVPASRLAVKLNKIKELETDDEKHQWVWLRECDADIGNTAGKDGSDSKKIFMDTNITPEDGKVYSLYAGLEIKNKHLIVESNSEQRITVVEYFLKEKLGNLIGEAVLEIESPEDFSSLASDQPPTSNDRVLSEEELAAVQLMQDQHYKNWIDSEIPALGDKSPRQAVKTKEGRKGVISLLKKVDNMEQRKAKSNPEQIYDFGWLFEELGIKVSEL